MKIDKPDDVLLLQGYHARGGQPALMVTLAYTLEADGSYVPEQAVWPWLLTHFTDQPFDIGFKKDRGVFGVAGCAYAPQNRPVTAMAVRAQVGALQKTLHVHGDRCWEKKAAWQPGPAQAFLSMPVTLNRAFGGAGWSENPYGKGWCSDDQPAPGQGLPNIELPGAPVVSPCDRPGVATFSMLSAGAPSRMRWVGRVDAAWQRERFPWLPDDTDSRWFDGVPADQGMNAFWQGTEDWSVQGMHEHHTEVAGKLPGLRPRLLVRRTSSGDRAVPVSESLLDLDTVWLFPNEQRIMVMYRAAIPVSCEDASDIAALGVFTEMQTDTPATLSVLVQNWVGQDEEVSTEDAQVPSTSESVALPVIAGHAPALQESLEQAAAEIQEALGEGAAQANEILTDIEEKWRSQAGIDLDLPRIESPLLLADPVNQAGDINWGTFSTELEMDLKDALQAGQKEMEATVREMAEKAGQDPQQWLQDMRDVQAMTVSDQKLDLVDTLTTYDTRGVPEELHQELLDKARTFQEELDMMDAEFAELDASFAALPPRDRISETDSQTLTRDQVLERLAAGTSLSGAILTDLDLSAVSFRAADLSQVVVTNCNFTAADLSAAVLDQARIAGCNFTRTNLSSTSLHQVDVVDTLFSQARCNEARMTSASVSGCDFSRSDWSDAILDGSSIAESVLDEALFIQATMQATNLWAVRGQGVAFRRGQLAGLRVDSDSHLPEADFEQADLQGSSLQDSNLRGAVFNEATLDYAFIKNCILDHSIGWRASARATDFKGSSWAGARWVVANFMAASFDSTRLENVDFSGANLHAADVRTAFVKGLQLQGALLTRCDVLQQHAQAGGGTPV